MYQLLKALRRPLTATVILLLVAAIVLSLGINKPTGLTGKDEYLLGLRIPLEMMQRDVWWVPFVDGEPRLKKPPFIYWLGRSSFEAFGPSLAVARGITVAFALMLLGCTAWLGKRVTDSLQTGLLAGAILLGISGMASESRRLMLDVPVAALSTAAFCLYLRWLDRPAWRLLLLAAALLSAALLTKGPIAVIVFGAGIVALLIVYPDIRDAAFKRRFAHAVLAAIAIALPVIWYAHVKTHFGAQLAIAAQDELEARQLLAISPDALIGLMTLAMPWTFVALHAVWTGRRTPGVRFLGIWLLLTLLPFIFIRSFERYLIGSLAPLAVIAAIGLQSGTVPAWARRLGSLVPALLSLCLGTLLWRFELGGWPALLAVTVYFLWAWWRTGLSPRHMIASAILLWAIGWGIAFPGLGVNAVPTQVVELARNRPVILFAGPQPAMLPMLLGKPLHQTSQLRAAELRPGALLMVRAEDVTTMNVQLRDLNTYVKRISGYRSLTSSGSGIRFARQGATADDWRKAWQSRSTDPLASTIEIYEVMSGR